MAETKTQSNSTSAKTADAAHEAIDKIAEKAQTAEDNIRQAADDAERRIKDKSTEARVKSSELSDSLTDRIRENPLASVGVALAAGYILSSVLRR